MELDPRRQATKRPKKPSHAEARIHWHGADGVEHLGPRHAATLSEQQEVIAVWARRTSATPAQRQQALNASWPAILVRAERAARLKAMGVRIGHTPPAHVVSLEAVLGTAIVTDTQRRELEAILST